MYIHIYIYIYICLFIYTYVYICMYVCVYIYIYIYIHTYIHTYTGAQVFIFFTAFYYFGIFNLLTGIFVDKAQRVIIMIIIMVIVILSSSSSSSSSSSTRIVSCSRRLSLREIVQKTADWNICSVKRPISVLRFWISEGLTQAESEY